MEYKALYRKFRPKTFDEVIGQTHVTDTLKNQIINNNTGHAYLFSGIRGTGKTSIAKILARAVNCLDLKDGNPCNECEACMSALNDNNIDIIEIDAASNNGVDDIRDIREKTKYPPSTMKYKVYIIDEVHMLSIGAFNALLKTLEEPPSYIIFIFATTEIHKIPETIISRCQKYDLKRIGEEGIYTLLKRVLSSLDYSYEEGVLESICRRSEGAARDAMSILEQCISKEEKTITKRRLDDVLGLVTEDIIINIILSLWKKNNKQTLIDVDKILKSGKDPSRFINQLIEYFRYFMLLKVSEENRVLVDSSESLKDEIISYNKDISLGFLLRSINILTDIEGKMKYSSNTRIIFEIALIKIMTPEIENTSEAIMERLDRLEKNRVYMKEPVEEEKPKEEKIDIKELKEVEAVQNSLDLEEIPVKETEEELIVDEMDSDEEDLWEDVLDFIKSENQYTYALINQGKFSGIKKGFLHLEYDSMFSFNIEALQNKERLSLIKQALYNVYNKNLEVKFNMVEEEIEPKEDNDILDFLGSYKDKLKIIE